MTTFGLTSSLDSALNLVVQGGSEVKGLLKALAGKTDLSILSSPQVLVLNNETATVNVGEEVPIVTTITENEYTSGSDVPKVDKTIQYKNTGVILEVTPQINYDGIIILDVKQTVSKALPIQADGVQSNPIRTRELKTKFAVKDGQSILIGGLIGTDNTITDSGIPLLKDIPILGYLFKYENRTLVKTELLIMLTPYVIETEDVLDQYIKEFQGKMNELRQELHRSPGIISGTTR
jgi:general secretion pathway protein D